MVLKIAFHPASNGGLSYRGTEVAMYDYADNIEKILGHKSLICLKNNAFSEPNVLEKFKQRFDSFIYYNNTEDLEKQLIDNKVNYFYTIRHGQREEPILKTIPMLVHAVYDMGDPIENTKFAAISRSVAEKFQKKEFVPHMINIYETDQDFRHMLNIPKNAIVFGRHGGEDTWDLQMAKEALVQVLSKNPNIYFLFAVRPNILNDITHPKLICLKSFADNKTKRKFINTCNALLHAQQLGETFGLSVGEMSVCNKPVITWNGGVCQEHLRILGKKCIKYETSEELYKILTTFNPEEMGKKDWNAYDDYNPEKVMKIFNDVFLA